MKKVLLISLVLLASCSTLKDAALGALGAGGGGLDVSAELNNADGDITKDVTLGTVQDVEATTVGEVNGDKQVATAINNYELSPFAMILISVLFALCLLFWALPTPATMWQKFRKRNR